MTNIALVTIGDEILNGFITNTNAQFIAQTLFQHNYALGSQVTLQDNKTALKLGLKQLIADYALVITTGGLGPTDDDTTLEAVAALLDKTLIQEETIYHFLTKRFKHTNLDLKRQSLIPEGAHYFLNHIGTAPGIVCHLQNKTLILLPGVPQEMKHMFLTSVLPYLQQHFKPNIEAYNDHLHFFQLPESNVNAYLSSLKPQYPNLSFGLYPNLGKLSVHLYIQGQDPTNKETLHFIRENLINQFSQHYFHTDTGTLEDGLASILLNNQLSLSITQLIPTSLLADLLHQTLSSEQFLKGCLSIHLSELSQLGLTSNDINSLQSNPEQFIQLLYSKARNYFNTDFVIAISNISSPLPPTNKTEQTTVWLALGYKNKTPIIKSISGFGDRPTIARWVAHVALSESIKLCYELGEINV